MKKTILVILLLIVSFQLYAETEQLNLKCYIRLKKLTYEIGEPIPITFQIKNTGSNKIVLEISEKFYFNFAFLVKTRMNRIVNERNDFFLEKRDNRDLNLQYRTIVLSEGEIFGRTINLNLYYEFTKPGTYIIQGFFYPVPNNTHRVRYYKTNKFRIIIKNKKYKEKILRRRREEALKVLRGIKTPWDTISYILASRIKKNWREYYRFIDLTKLVETDYEFRDKYKSLVRKYPSRANAIIDQFKKKLKTYPFPHEQMTKYQLLSSRVDLKKGKALVSAIISYKYSGIMILRKYKFRLYKKSDKWYLYNYDVIKVQ